MNSLYIIEASAIDIVFDEEKKIFKIYHLFWLHINNYQKQKAGISFDS